MTDQIEDYGEPAPVDTPAERVAFSIAVRPLLASADCWFRCPHCHESDYEIPPDGTGPFDCSNCGKPYQIVLDEHGQLWTAVTLTAADIEYLESRFGG